MIQQDPEVLSEPESQDSVPWAVPFRRVRDVCVSFRSVFSGEHR